MKYKKHIKLYKRNTDLENVVCKFMNNFMNEYSEDLNIKMNIIEFLYLLHEFTTDFYELKKKKSNKLKNLVINHSCRVLKHLLSIIKNLEQTGEKFSVKIRYDMLVGAMMHDIGKFITENTGIDNDEHSVVSYLMMKYLLDRCDIISQGHKTIILEMILMHSNKTKDRDNISIYDKILRDADLFDEKCGDSLLELLKYKSKCVNTNLNTIYYDESYEIIDELSSYKNIKYINKRINIEQNKKLFENEFKRAIIDFNEFVHHSHIEQQIIEEHERISKLSQCLYINIEI